MYTRRGKDKQTKNGKSCRNPDGIKAKLAQTQRSLGQIIEQVAIQANTNWGIIWKALNAYMYMLEVSVFDGMGKAIDISSLRTVFW